MRLMGAARNMVGDRSRIKFVAALLFYPVRSLLGRIGIRYDITAITNAYYREAFARVPAADKALLLPHCLIDEKCPARFSKADGILCIQCKRCGCGEMHRLCQEQGWQFYITPSANFTKRLVQRKGLRAAVGAACDLEIEKGIRSTRITLRGIFLKKRKVIPQVIRTARYDCLKNEIDWERIREIIRGGEEGPREAPGAGNPGAPAAPAGGA
jgi:hypothetical protein